MDSSWRRHPQLPWRKAEGLKICVTFPGMQQPGEMWNPLSHLGLNPFTATDCHWLDMRTLEKLDIVVSIVSTCILHDNTAGGILMFCKLWTLWALCLCDRAVPPPDFLSQESTQSPVPRHLQNVTAKSRFPLDLWSNLFQEWVLWRLCLILLLIFVFLMLCFYAALH